MRESEQSRSRRILPIISIVTFLGFLDTYLLIPVIALYASGLGASVGTIGLIVGLYSLVNTPANLFFGRLIDRIGYKIPLFAGLFGDALSMFLYSVSRLPVHLSLVRVLHGISGASVGPATMLVIADYSDRQQEGRSMGLYGMAMGMATLAGFGLSGIVASRLGTKAVFLVGTALLAVGAVLSLFLPRSKKPAHSESKTSLVGGLARLKDLLRRKGLVVAYISIFAQYVTFGSVVTLLPLFVKNQGMEAFHLTMSLAVFSIMFIILQFPSGALADKVGRLIPTIIGLSLGIVSLVVMPLVETFPLLIAVMAVYGIAYGLLFPSISALVADHALPEERGLATGIFHALLTAGVAIGAPVMGWVGGTVGIELGLALSSSLMAVALAVALTLLKRI